MPLVLTDEERSFLNGEAGEARALAMRVIAETARLMGAGKLIPVASSHIDGALYHGDSGTLFAEKLVELGAMSNDMALLLSGCVKARLNVLISGGTG